MRVPSHLEKFRRLDAVLNRLDPVADRELWIWTAMNACTNLLNAALHHCGATRETDSFHTQVSGLYAVPDRARGGLSDALHPPGDVMHFGQPPIAAALPAAIERAGAALQALEDLRERFVRGNEPVPPDAERGWRQSYAVCTAELAAVLGLENTL
jgi:hypothetical protein